MTVPLAPLEEELQIVERIRELFTRANEAEQSVNAALKNAELLERSVLEKAFRGELVPQDPNDEPASVLLERIRAQRGTMGRKTTRRKLGGVRKSCGNYSQLSLRGILGLPDPSFWIQALAAADSPRSGC
ncbi:MAG: hypothetical protein ABSG74_08015 [Candidatus Bathyarchaeia archaeon]